MSSEAAAVDLPRVEDRQVAAHGPSDSAGVANWGLRACWQWEASVLAFEGIQEMPRSCWRTAGLAPDTPTRNITVTYYFAPEGEGLRGGGVGVAAVAVWPGVAPGPVRWTPS
jgi:hypothetical protein